MANITFLDFDTGALDPTVIVRTSAINGVSGSVLVGPPGRTGQYSLQLIGPVAQAGLPIYGVPPAAGFRFDFLPPSVGLIASDIAQIQTANAGDLWPTLAVAPISTGGYTLTLHGTGLAIPTVNVLDMEWRQLQFIVDTDAKTLRFGVDNLIHGPYPFTAPMGTPLFVVVINSNGVVGLRGDGLYSEKFSFDNLLTSDGVFAPITYGYTLPTVVASHVVEHNSNPPRYAFINAATASLAMLGSAAANRIYAPVAVASMRLVGHGTASRTISTLAHGVIAIVHGRIRKRAAIAVTATGTVGGIARGAGATVVRRRSLLVHITGSPKIRRSLHLTRSFLAHGVAGVAIQRVLGRTYTDNINFTGSQGVAPRVQPIIIPTTIATARIPTIMATQE